jgi:CP family cyanate transporter-like MFS transporter
MLILAWFVYITFGMMQRSVSPLVTPIMRDLGLTYGQMGAIMGSWQLACILAALSIGLALDRYSLRTLIGLGAIVMALSGLLRSLAASYEALFAAVFIFGVGGPTISIGAPKLISIWFEGNDKKHAAGLYATGPALGSVIVFSSANSIVMPWLGSWRLTFVFFAMLVIAALVLWMLFSKDAGSVSSAEASVPFHHATLSLVKIRNVLIIVLVGFSNLTIVHGLWNWLPKIVELASITPEQAGYLAAIPSATGIVGALLIPRCAPEFKLKYVVASLLGISSISTYAIGTTTGVSLVIALASQGVAIGAMLPLCMLMLMNTKEVGSALMGAAGGLYFTVAEVGGFAGPYVVGRLVDLTGSFYSSILLLASLQGVMIPILLSAKKPTIPL